MSNLDSPSCCDALADDQLQFGEEDLRVEHTACAAVWSSGLDILRKWSWDVD